MLVLHVTILISTLNLAVGVGQFSSSVKPKRGVVENVHDVPQDYKLHKLHTPNPSQRSIPSNHGKSLHHYKDVKVATQEPSLIGPASYGSVYKQPYSNLHPSQSPYFENLFTMSAGFKVASDDKPLRQTRIHQGNVHLANQDSRNQKPGRVGVHTGIQTVQVPVYRTGYPVSKAMGAAPAFHSSPYAKRTSLPMVQVHSDLQQPVYYHNVHGQQLVLSPVDIQYTFPARVPKVNNVQLSAPFSSPLSSFQGQVVPISTTGSNRQFPQYKGAAIEVHPTVGGFPAAGYESLQSQPQLHFGNGNVQYVQNVGGHRQAPVEEIRSDVEIIDKKKPTTPPPEKDDDDDDEDDEGYSSAEKEHGSDGRDDDDDDHEDKSEKPFKSPRVEGDFKPSTSFPFKQYDSTFGKYSNNDEEDDEEPQSKHREYSSSSDDDEEDETPSSKYQSEDTSSRPYYGKQEDDEEEEEDSYEKQKTDSSYHKYRPKYFDKNFDEEFDRSYKKQSPRQSYIQRTEMPKVEYGFKSSRKNKDSYDSEDSTSQGSSTNFDYQRIPQGYKDSEGQSSDTILEMAFDKKSFKLDYEILELKNSGVNVSTITSPYQHYSNKFKLYQTLLYHLLVTSVFTFILVNTYASLCRRLPSRDLLTASTELNCLFLVTNMSLNGSI
ncbi:uncharacterized protein LOC143181386 [Calliopsis andreniformis]|uniref:uncharacterized protein LOC143181386 n=1 Tax=Calliopsis andreniformis TaxID=337506 RepID=UPI003FCCFAED